MVETTTSATLRDGKGNEATADLDDLGVAVGVLGSIDERAYNISVFDLRTKIIRELRYCEFDWSDRSYPFDKTKETLCIENDAEIQEKLVELRNLLARRVVQKGFQISMRPVQQPLWDKEPDGKDDDAGVNPDTGEIPPE